MIARKLKGRITEDHCLEVVLPEDVEPGVVEIILLREDTRPSADYRPSESTTSHPAFGIWADRTDLPDSWAFAAGLRQRVERRRDGEPVT